MGSSFIHFIRTDSNEFFLSKIFLFQLISPIPLLQVKYYFTGRNSVKFNQIQINKHSLEG